ncbi:50S ribosomal protein L11 [Candidatus Woesearchaeota archaeon]|nr:50S ribosomal protein L11 [Candidatus Woesearchaeota archaeon]MBW2994142.1 50S ribosomal protein L11 [Candidatus Woesearchaeota archaeon]
MADQVIECLIEGGKATAAPPLGPALGPAGVNIGQVVAEINKKTADFKGMKVPVKVTVKSDKSFTITVGTPPVSALVKKEAGVDKGAGNPLADKVADLKIEQVIKIAKMKEDALLGKNMISKVKEILGSCDSMGIMVEGKQAREVIADINKGDFVEKIKSGKTELSAEDLKKLAEEKKKLQEDLEKKRKVYEATAKDIIAKMEGKARGEIKTKLVEAKVPSVIIEELLPAETKEGAKGDEKKAAAPAPAKK